MATKHVVSVFLVDRAEGTTRQLEGTFVKAIGHDNARKAAREAVEAMGYGVRTVSFSTDGRILVYTEGLAPKRRKRSIAASTLGVSQN
jgi:hypothetical protein